jgi:hypothetical protein
MLESEKEVAGTNKKRIKMEKGTLKNRLSRIVMFS